MGLRSDWRPARGNRDERCQPDPFRKRRPRVCPHWRVWALVQLAFTCPAAGVLAHRLVPEPYDLLWDLGQVPGLHRPGLSPALYCS